MSDGTGEVVGGVGAAMHAAAWREGLDAAVQQARASVDRLVAARANQGTAQLQGFFLKPPSSLSGAGERWARTTEPARAP